MVLGRGSIGSTIIDHQLDYHFEVHYLRDEPVDRFLAHPHLAPFASLADVPAEHRPRMLRRALDLIATTRDAKLREVLAQAAADLAHIYLDPATIDTTWKESAMPVPSYLDALEEHLRTKHREEGLVEGRQEGLERGRSETLASLLRHRFGGDDRIPAVARRLAADDLDEALTRIDAASGLDDLADD